MRNVSTAAAAVVAVVAVLPAAGSFERTHAVAERLGTHARTAHLHALVCAVYTDCHDQRWSVFKPRRVAPKQLCGSQTFARICTRSDET